MMKFDDEWLDVRAGVDGGRGIPEQAEACGYELAAASWRLRAGGCGLAAVGWRLRGVTRRKRSQGQSRLVKVRNYQEFSAGAADPAKSRQIQPNPANIFFGLGTALDEFMEPTTGRKRLQNRRRRKSRSVFQAICWFQYV
jgi:hypothetical protein